MNKHIKTLLLSILLAVPAVIAMEKNNDNQPNPSGDKDKSKITELVVDGRTLILVGATEDVMRRIIEHLPSKSNENEYVDALGLLGQDNLLTNAKQLGAADMHDSITRLEAACKAACKSCKCDQIDN